MELFFINNKNGKIDNWQTFKNSNDIHHYLPARESICYGNFLNLFLSASSLPSTFYELYEIIQMYNINTIDSPCLCISDEACYSALPKHSIIFKESAVLTTNDIGNFSLLFMNIKHMDAREVVRVLTLIITNQSHDGSTILSVNNLESRVAYELIYILGYLYKHIHLIKPMGGNICSDRKYIICTHFRTQVGNHHYDLCARFRYLDITSKSTTLLFDKIIPAHLYNRIEEFNVIVGQQYLDRLNLCLMTQLKENASAVAVLQKQTESIAVQWIKKFTNLNSSLR
tara:strand:+ start:942 stop:1793 length:852 start_codon:yes stop_codon:yes gene_type:complete